MSDFEKLVGDALVENPDFVAAELQRKLDLITAKEEQLKLREGLPFLHGWGWYPWAREFFESQNKLNFLCAANQISKSSTQIRKAINWATDTALWPDLWSHQPTQFWYLYPTSKQARIEFQTKWKQFLPKGEYKSHPVYGWKDTWVNKELFAIEFNSGVSIYFKSYAQDTSSLQTGTVDALFCDEELPVEHYEELMFRLSASDGYFHMVFTATMGQDFWRRVMEPLDFEVEALPEAAKWTVSLYDAQKYEDGTPSHWTDEKIQMVVDRCSTPSEVLKRVWGKFVKADGGRKYEQFDVKKNVCKPGAIPDDWTVYAGIDIGSGGKSGHPGAICFVAVSPDRKKGVVFDGWRGDGIQTTAEDIMGKFLEMRRGLGRPVAFQYYDWQARDFATIAERISEPFIKADKSHDLGEQVINSLFKHCRLMIFQTDELRKLSGELLSLRKDQAKTKAKDDFADAMRYALTSIPWDFSDLTNPDAPKMAPDLSPMEKEIAQRREMMSDEGAPLPYDPMAEIAEWNEYYGN